MSIVQSKMADDKEVLREIWDGKVPVCFVLSLDEIVAGGSEPLAQFVSMKFYPNKHN